VFINVGKNYTAKIFQALFGVWFLTVFYRCRDTDEGAAGGLAEKGFQGNKPLLFPIVCGKGIADLEPIEKDLPLTAFLDGDVVYIYIDIS
jgi:hypothetical protein